ESLLSAIYYFYPHPIGRFFNLTGIHCLIQLRIENTAKKNLFRTKFSSCLEDGSIIVRQHDVEYWGYDYKLIEILVQKSNRVFLYRISLNTMAVYVTAVTHLHELLEVIKPGLKSPRTKSVTSYLKQYSKSRRQRHRKYSSIFNISNYKITK
ncbi:hypothetical protein BC833DRAFT_570040, partial [Globomyces pollinis-pini]